MSSRQIGRIVVAVLAAVGVAAPARAAVTAAPGYAVRTIPTPGTVQDSVARRDGAIFVGQGAFGVGLQQIVRIDESGTTELASGFNSLGGMDLGPDGTLYVVDNGGNGPGALTGDTVFAIPFALTRTTSLPAVGLEVVPAGTIPAAQDVLVVPGALIVSDAVGPGAGRVVRVKGTKVTELITGLDYTASLAFAGGRLLVGNLDGSFVGAVYAYTLAGVPVGDVATGLSGNYAHVVDNDGDVLVSGGFADDFSSSIVAVDAMGGVTERARGFSFSSEMYQDVARAETLALDFGVSAITAICRDTDDDDVCDADESPCEGGVAASKVSLAIAKLDTPAGDDTLSLKGQVVLPTPIAPALDLVANGVRVSVSDAEGEILDAIIPGGAVDPVLKSGWKVNAAGTAWKFASKTGIRGIVGVTVKLSTKTPGLVEFSVKGKGGSYATSSVDLPLTASVSVGAPGQCGDAGFPGPSPAPACAFDAKGKKVVCK